MWRWLRTDEAKQATGFYHLSESVRVVRCWAGRSSSSACCGTAEAAVVLLLLLQ